MDARFGATLLVVILVAVVVGVAAAQTQPKHAVSKAAAPVATSVLSAPPGYVQIISRPPASETPSGCKAQSSEAIFCPQTVTVKVGQPVIWLNLATVTHNVSADDGSFTSPVLTSQAGRSLPVHRDQAYVHVFKKAGRYPYSDFLHPDMHGLVVVRP